MDTVVVSIGGSILIPDEGDSDYIRRLSDTLRPLTRDVNMVLVCGGGRISRYYARTGRELGGSVEDLDRMGIDVTRVNARLLSIALGSACPVIPLTVGGAANLLEEWPLVIMGGTEPGHTTDGVAAMVAEAVGADRLVNATSVDAAYTADPKSDADAKRIESMTYEDLSDLIYDEHDAGASSVFDPLGVEVVTRCGMKLCIVAGRDLEDLRSAILGKDIKGTVVQGHRS